MDGEIEEKCDLDGVVLEVDGEEGGVGSQLLHLREEVRR